MNQRQPVAPEHYQPLYEAYRATLHLQSRSKLRTFLVKFDNSKRRKMGTALQSYEAEGVVFSSGRVCIDTDNSAQRGYGSIDEMEGALSKWGNCRISWMEEG